METKPNIKTENASMDNDLFGQTNFLYRLTDPISQVPPPSSLEINRKTRMLQTMGEAASNLAFYPDSYQDMCTCRKLPKLSRGNIFDFVEKSEFGDFAPVIPSPEEKSIKNLDSILNFMGVSQEKREAVEEMKDQFRNSVIKVSNLKVKKQDLVYDILKN